MIQKENHITITILGDIYSLNFQDIPLMDLLDVTGVQFKQARLVGPNLILPSFAINLINNTIQAVRRPLPDNDNQIKQNGIIYNPINNQYLNDHNNWQYKECFKQGADYHKCSDQGVIFITGSTLTQVDLDNQIFIYPIDQILQDIQDVSIYQGHVFIISGDMIFSNYKEQFQKETTQRIIVLCEGSVDVKLINYYDYKDIKPKNENRYNGDEFMESVQMGYRFAQKNKSIIQKTIHDKKRGLIKIDINTKKWDKEFNGSNTINIIQNIEGVDLFLSISQSIGQELIIIKSVDVIEYNLLQGI